MGEQSALLKDGVFHSDQRFPTKSATFSTGFMDETHPPATEVRLSMRKTARLLTRPAASGRRPAVLPADTSFGVMGQLSSYPNWNQYRLLQATVAVFLCQRLADRPLGLIRGQCAVCRHGLCSECAARLHAALACTT
jgi:hypothetical protein